MNMDLSNKKGIFPQIDLSNENIVHVKKEGVEYLQFKKLLEFDSLVHCFSLKIHDVDFKRSGENVNIATLKNSYEKISNALNINQEQLRVPKQSHTDCIKNVENEPKSFKFSETKVDGFYNNVDGLVTNKTNYNLVSSFADCTPILLYDPVRKVIGNVHSGWRGTVQKIGQKAAIKMMNDYGSKPEDIIACIGPCICKCHFEVEDDVKQTFENTFNYLQRNHDIIEQTSSTKYHIDTVLINKLILEEVGVKNIILSNICSVCNSNFIHSYRADGENAGRNIAILGMKNV